MGEINTDGIRILSGILQEYGFYAFAALAVFGFWATKEKGPRAFFGLLIAAGMILSAVVFWFPPRPQVMHVRGELGTFTAQGLPKVVSLDKGFYISLRETGDSTGVEWAVFFDAGRLLGDQLKVGVFLPYVKRTVDGNEQALIGGPISFPLKPFRDRNFDRDQLIKLKLVPDANHKNGVCITGGPFTTPLCNERPDDRGSNERPWLPKRSFAGKIFDQVIPSAHAQRADELSEQDVRLLLASNDLQQLRRASKEIGANPVKHKMAVNETLEKPIGTNTYAARLAIASGLLEAYRPKKFVYSNDAEFAWLSDAAFRRIILDSLDRSDVLGETTRRLLRSTKSDRVRRLLEQTLAEAASKVPSLETCLGTLKQDIYVNWAILSLGWLIEANQLTEAKARLLADLLSDLQFGPSDNLQSAYKLRANYMKANIVLLSAVRLGQPANGPLETEGIELLRSVRSSIEGLGKANVEKAYYGNLAELTKVMSFLDSLTDPRPLKIDILERREGTVRGYPNCEA